MRIELLSHWIQILTGVAVLVGLGLVIYELRQTKTLVEAQLSSDGWAYTHSYTSMIVGENAISSLSKICTDPAAVTEADALMLNHVYSDAFFRVRRAKVVYQIAETSSPWQVMAEGLAGIYNTPHGRWWWAKNKDRLDPEIVSVAGPFITARDVDGCKELTEFAELR